MGANILTTVTPQLLAQGLLELREMAMMPMLVNSDFDGMAAQRGATIDVPIPSAIAAQEVAPANVPPATATIAPTSVQIPLDQWWEAPFYLTDREMMEIQAGYLPKQAASAVKSIANNVNGFILSKYKNVYGWVAPVSGSGDPFQSGTEEAVSARKVLNDQLAPLDERRFVIDTGAEANALNLRAFQDVSWSGSLSAIMEGRLNRKLGFDWWMHQLIPTHTNGTATGYSATGGEAAGSTTIAITGGSNAFVAGDVITIVGLPGTYAVTVGGTTSISIYPASPLTVPNGAIATLGGTAYTVNLAFHRDAFAFAMRPLERSAEGLGSIIETVFDPQSGLSMRLEVTREHKRTRFSYDVLYGAALVRPELATRVAGLA